jgi:putative DNA primase/helicase
MPIGQVPRYVAVIADRNPVNPIGNWITNKPWDSVDRLQDLFDTLVVRDDFPITFKGILMEKWLLSAVAAATLPTGFHGRGALTLQGPQGIGKTSWIRSLMPKGPLRDRSILTGHHLDPSNKDSQTTAIKYWIVEVGELDSSLKKDVARLKGFMTQDKDTVRRPYARTNSEYQRRTVFCASVNEENFLIDNTGNSRFWTIPVVEIDYNHDIDMQQAFAQLYVMFKQGAKWWLSSDEDRQLNELNQSHRAVSAIEERISAVLNFDISQDQWIYKSPIQLLLQIGIRNPTNPQCKECAAFLKRTFGEPKKVNGNYSYKIPLDRSRIPE